MRMLMLTSVASMIDQFNMPNIHMLLDMGYQVDVACNFLTGNTCSKEKIDTLKATLVALGVEYHQIDFSRSLIRIGDHLTAYKQVKRLLEERDYDFIHCHSPIGGLVARLAGKATRTRTIYTAHGFHFYKGAPLKNWLLYYPVEWLCAHWTDTLITINQEDYALAQKHMHAKKVVYVPGVGVNLERFGHAAVDKEVKRKELGIPENAKLLISVGELNDNKNHETVIKAITGMDIYYIIAGAGNKKEYLQSLIDTQKLTDRIKLLGYRTDVQELYGAADVFVFPSFREGLSVALMEAMASGKPCVVSRIRGNTDLIDENGGVFFDPHDVEDCKNALQQVLDGEPDLMGAYNAVKSQQYDLTSVIEQMKPLYECKVGGEAVSITDIW